MTGKTVAEPAAPGAEQSDPLPISLEVDSPITLVGHEITFNGKTIALLSNDVSLDIKAPNAAPPQSSVIKGTAGLDGQFTLHFTPSVAGLYTAVVTAPDHRGTGTAQFRVVDPGSATDVQDLSQSIPRLIRYVPQIFDQINSKLNDLPPSPAKDTLKRNMQTVIKQANDLELPANDEADDLAALLAAKWTIENNPDAAYQRMAAERQQRIEADRLKVVRYLGEVEDWELRSKEELEAISKRAVLCDNLEVVQEGINLVSGMLNLFNPKAGDVVKAFATDFGANAVGSAAGSVTGNDYAGFGAQETTKQWGIAQSLIKKESVLLNNASGFVGLMNDEIGLGVSIVVSLNCEVFSGPVKAHMHAKFFKDGRMWWEYAFDVQGQLTLHYPKSASGGSVPLKGRLEGFATNYKLWEDSLSVLYPGLMSSTVQPLHLKIMPTTASTQPGIYPTDYAPVFNQVRKVEGSGISQLVTPSSFFFEVTGTATADKLTVNLGPARHDTNDKATVVVLGLPVWSLAPAVWVYPLPFKPVHFVFEHASPPGQYVIPLTTVGQAMTGKQVFNDERSSGNGEAWGEYSADIKVCNPGC